MIIGSPVIICGDWSGQIRFVERESEKDGKNYG
jgi:hypothetical protein